MIEVNQLSVKFDDDFILKDVSFKLGEGEKMVIVGKSGCGKSTLLHALLGFVPVASGEIKINEKVLNKKNLSFIRSRTSYMPQENAFPVISVNAFVFDAFRWNKNKTKKPENSNLENYLLQWDLPADIMHKRMNEISGGQKQRLLLISILLLDKKVLFFDEPTSSLDNEVSEKIKQYVMKDNDKTVVVCTHERSWVAEADYVLDFDKVSR